MNLTEFQKMAEIEKEEEMSNLKVGDYFLYGKNVIAQKQNKSPGQEISFYQVVRKHSGGSVEYAPVFEVLSNEQPN